MTGYAGKDVEEGDYSSIADGNANQYGSFSEIYAFNKFYQCLFILELG